MDEEELDRENGDVIKKSIRGIVNGVETCRFGGGELDNESAEIGVVVTFPGLAGVVLSTRSRR